MPLEETSRGYEARFNVVIDPADYPKLMEHLRADADFRKLISENLERAVGEFLTACEAEIARRGDQSA